MTYFPEWFFVALVYVAIALTALGSITLIALLVRDFRGRSLW